MSSTSYGSPTFFNDAINGDHFWRPQAAFTQAVDKSLVCIVLDKGANYTVVIAGTTKVESTGPILAVFGHYPGSPDSWQTLS